MRISDWSSDVCSSDLQDVLADLARPDVEPLRLQLVEQFGVDQVDLPEVRLGRVARDARAVLHRLAEMRVAGDTEAGDEADLGLIGLAERVRGAAADRDDSRHAYCSGSDVQCARPYRVAG